MDVDDIDFSAEFFEAFNNAGGGAYDCDCGREHVDVYRVQESYLNEEEREAEEQEYEKRAETDKNLILYFNDEALDVMSIAGQDFVYGCECEGWKKYMKFLIRYRYPIKDFLVSMADELQNAAEREKTFKILKNTNI